MIINAYIEEIRYKPFLCNELKSLNFEEFNINNITTANIVIDKNKSFCISRWVSPKRTRSYPYARVYDTLQCVKKITVIPVIKDEGKYGDRDFIQWDTISLMSLLDIYVILAYYKDAEIKTGHKPKITNQKLDNEYILKKIKEISNYQSSALHWNINELSRNLGKVIKLSQFYYNKISQKYNIELHNQHGIEKVLKKILADISNFKLFSREKAKLAQNREINTLQPKEFLSLSSKKAKIIIKNYLGGEYYFTCDEVYINKEKKEIKLIEAKHTKTSLLPSKNDIKDGLLKMVLYVNLIDVKHEGETYQTNPVLKLSSNKINIPQNKKEFYLKKDNLDIFLTINNLNKEKKFLLKLLQEAEENGFNILIVKN